jgi:hypothetical protein
MSKHALSNEKESAGKILKKLAAVKSWKKHIITNRHIGPCDL